MHAGLAEFSCEGGGDRRTDGVVEDFASEAAADRFVGAQAYGVSPVRVTERVVVDHVSLQELGLCSGVGLYLWVGLF
jgi:hypothetical protein